MLPGHAEYPQHMPCCNIVAYFVNYLMLLSNYEGLDRLLCLTHYQHMPLCSNHPIYAWLSLSIPGCGMCPTLLIACTLITLPDSIVWPMWFSSGSQELWLPSSTGPVRWCWPVFGYSGWGPTTVLPDSWHEPSEMWHGWHRKEVEGSKVGWQKLTGQIN